MPALDLTTTDAPGMQLCTPLVAGQVASAAGLAGASHVVWSCLAIEWDVEPPPIHSLAVSR